MNPDQPPRTFFALGFTSDHVLKGMVLRVFGLLIAAARGLLLEPGADMETEKAIAATAAQMELVFEESAILDLPAGHMRMGRDGYDFSSKRETLLGTVRVGGVDLGTGTNPCCAAPASACFQSECWFDHYEWKHKQALRSVSMILQ